MLVNGTTKRQRIHSILRMSQGFKRLATFWDLYIPWNRRWCSNSAVWKCRGHHQEQNVVAPTPDFVPTHSAYQTYLKRQPFDSQLTFVQWLRMYNETAAKPSKYRSGDTLVGVQTYSYFNPVFFYQFLAMHFPHSAEGELHHEREEQLPTSIKFFVKATELMPEIWNSHEEVKSWMAAEAHKSYLTTFATSYQPSTISSTCGRYE